MTSRPDVIAGLLRLPAPVREPLAWELRGSVVQLLGPGTTVPSWQATPKVLAEAIDAALQKRELEEKDTQAGNGRSGESTARGALSTGLQGAGADGALGPGSLTGGHALVVEHGAGELVGSCQCGRRLGRLTSSGSVDALAGLWELHLTQLAGGGER